VLYSSDKTLRNCLVLFFLFLHYTYTTHRDVNNLMRANKPASFCLRCDGCGGAY